MHHLFVPIDSAGEREQWFGCEQCPVKVPASELELAKHRPDLIGECVGVVAPESDAP